MERNEKKEPRLRVFRERFNILREEHGPSNTEFATFLAMSRQTIGFYLNGDRIPDALTLKNIADKCHVSADWLLGKTDIKTDNKVVSDICKYTGLSEDSVEKLHGKLKNDSALNVIHDFVNSFLSSRYLESFESVSFWNFALNVLSRRPPQRDATLEEYVKRRNKREQDIIDALYNGKSVGEYIEMDIGTAIHSYATRAKAYLELIYDETEYTKYIRPQYVKEEEL